MYQPTPTFRDRAGPMAAVVLIHVAIGYALLNLSGAGTTIAQRADVAIFDITLPPPPVTPPPPPPPPAATQDEKQKSKPRDEGAAAPENIRSTATPVVVPKPRIELPAPSPIIAAVKSGVGANATQGAGDVVGPGTGAGGVGNGTGSGGAGNGGGGGGRGGGPPSRPLIVEATKLTSRDYPPEAIRAWPRGGRVFVAVRVQLDGRATDCKINRSSGSPGVDADTCRLVMAKVRFVPARDEQGRPVVDWYGYVQEMTGRW